MKKLMIAAAFAAMIGGAQAVTSVTTKGHWEKTDCGKEWICGTEGCGTAHKVAITLKTTAAKNTKMNTCGDCEIYRVQATKKINGLIWQQLGEDECGCVVLFGDTAAFWTKDEAFNADFSVGVSKIGKSVNSKSIEAYGYLVNEDEMINLTWAGFGTVTGKSKAGKENPCGDDVEAYCVEYVKSITGGIAGILPAPGAKCADACVPVVYAACCEEDDEYSDMEDFTAAYGTIKITYDTATAKKVAVAEDPDDISTFFKVPATVVDEIEPSEVVIEE